jgi:uncharacterized protein YdhG (YjbR/CyaY superfamily)
MDIKTVDEFVEQKVLPELRPVVAALRGLMRELAPDAAEVMSYGIPAWRGRRILVVISPTKKDITFAFSRAPSSRTGTGCSRGWERSRST